MDGHKVMTFYRDGRLGVTIVGTEAWGREDCELREVRGLRQGERGGRAVRRGS